MKYSQELRDCLDWHSYVDLVHALGDQLNNRKDRFDKSDIIEQSLEVYTDGRLQYMDDVGVDHIDTVHNYTLEFKYVADGMYTAKNKRLKARVKVKLKNSLGTHKGTHIETPADWYVIGQQDAIGIIRGEDIKPYLVAVPDGIEAWIPSDSLDMVFTPGEYTPRDDVDINYKQAKLATQRRIIEGIKKG